MIKPEQMAILMHNHHTWQAGLLQADRANLDCAVSTIGLADLDQY